jgi:hypothetical protein
MVDPGARLAPPWSGRLHDALLVALVALRPLVWGGDPGAWDDLAYLALVALAAASVVAETWMGWRRSWRWSWGGLIAAALWLALLPAAARSPLPSHGWGAWGMLALHLALAAYLMQAIAGRERLAFAALAGGALVESAVALLQHCWVLPGIAAALARGEAAVAGMETRHGDLAERVGNGGIFGTFTLANTLAAYLLLVLVPLAASAWSSASARVRWPALALIALGVAALAGTASKGAYLALAAAAGCAWWLLASGWRRWPPLALGAAALAALALAPHLRAGLEASAAVRWEYWQGALALIGEAPLSGHGLGGFASNALRVMPLSAEPTRVVHNEFLEAWVDGGALAALLLGALLARAVAAARPPGASAWEQPSAASSERVLAAALPLLLLVPLFCALGMLASNLGWWPGAGSDAGWLAWSFAVATALAAGCVAAARLPAPPAWAWRVGLAAFALHCLVDFDLHSPGIWGTLAVACCLAGGAARTVAATMPRLMGASLVLLALLGGLWYGSGRALELQRADSLAQVVAGCRRDIAAGRAPGPDQLGTLAYLLGEPPPSGGDDALRRLAPAALERIAALAAGWPRSAEAEAAAVALRPAGDERLAASAALAAHQPTDPAARAMLAQDLAATGRWEEAVAAQAEAVRLAPANLARRIRFAELLDQAAGRVPGRAAEWRERAATERARIAELLPLVHPRNRP